MACFLTLSLLAASVTQAEDPPKSAVGMRGRIEQIVVPGSELEVKPLDDPRTPVVLRIVAVYPHGTAHRYDLEYWSLEPGTFDLRDYLRRKDGSTMEIVPALRVEVSSVLPAGQVLPNKLESHSSPWLGGYRLLLVAGGILWVLGLLAILFLGRRRKQESAATEKPLTVADRLRPLIESGMAGGLSQTQRAELERTLLAFWRRRLRLEDVKPIDAMARMRRHADSGPLLEQLELWLHRPGTAANVDVNTLLRPYQNVPDEEWETGQRDVQRAI